MKKTALLVAMILVVAFNCFAEPAAVFEKFGLNNMLPKGKYTIIDMVENEAECDYSYKIDVPGTTNLEKDRVDYLNQIINSVLAAYPYATTYDDYYQEIQLQKRPGLNPYEYVTIMFSTEDGWEYTLSFADFGWSRHEYNISIYGVNYGAMWDDIDWDALMAELSLYDLASEDMAFGSDDEYGLEDIDWGALFGGGDVVDYEAFEDSSEGDDFGFEELLGLFEMDRDSMILAAYAQDMDVEFNGDEIRLINREDGSAVTKLKDGRIKIEYMGEVLFLVQSWPSEFSLSKYLPKYDEKMPVLYCLCNERTFLVQFDFLDVGVVRSYGEKLAEKFPIGCSLTDDEMFGMSVYEFNGYNNDGFKCEFVSMFGMVMLAVGVPGESELLADLLGEV